MRGGAPPCWGALADLQVRDSILWFKIVETMMIKRGAQKEGAKDENKRPEPQSARAGSVQMQFATFHEDSTIHRKSLNCAYPFSIILCTFPGAFAKKWSKGSRARPQSGKQMRQWIPRVPKWSPKVSQSAKKTLS